MEILYYFFGPRLYMDYSTNSEEIYSLAVLEKIGDYLLNTLLLILRLCLYLSPMIGFILLRQDCTMSSLYSKCFKIFFAVGFLLTTAICFRAIGRYKSESYANLISALNINISPEEKRAALALFDFDFRWWPIDFDVRSLPIHSRTPLLTEFEPTLPNILQYIPAYIFTYAIGLYLLYPGGIRLLQSYMRPNLVEGRAELILKRGAHRYKIKTEDRNAIDTVFVDNRDKTKNGRTLVINCEGNMSFYSISVVNTNLARYFSVLGWNHPGFEGSTGNPFPKQEYKAIDAVMKFAIYKLHFNENDILIYGWSIGGYSAICGAMQYTRIKGLILDATFDDVVHLAYYEVPQIFKSFVHFCVRCFCNLHNSKILENYHGPVLVIRRLFDETISPDCRLSTNRTNHLVIALLNYRYPNIFQRNQVEALQRTLSRPMRNSFLRPDEIAACWSRLLIYVAAEGINYPMTIGENFTEEVRNEMAEFLLRKYCRDFRSSHCPPLPPEYFEIPWDGYTKST